MIYSLITIFLLLFTFITWTRFHLGLTLFFFLLPTYLIRFHIGPLPTTLLEMMFVIFFVIWTIKQNKNIIYHLSPKKDALWLSFIIKKNKLLFIGILLFILAATFSIFTSSNTRSALGEWKAFYIEPVLMFLIIMTTLKSSNKKLINNIIFALILSGLLTSLLAIYQHFTGWMVPEAFWANHDTFRITAWYGFPNAVGLFLAPIFPLAIYLLMHNFNELKKRNWKLFAEPTSKIPTAVGISCILFLTISPLAIFFTKSTGALIGLIAGISILLLFYKKTRIITLVILASGIFTLILLPSSNPIKQELLLQDRSGQIRLSMWSNTFEFLKDHPIKGAGLASYSEKIIPYHTTVNGEGIEIFHHPHNIFLTMWVNLGLLGLVSFTLILIWFFKTSLLRSMLRNNSTVFILSSIVIIIIMGLVDSPYIKNDLAMFFWLLPTLLIINTQSKSA